MVPLLPHTIFAEYSETLLILPRRRYEPSSHTCDAIMKSALPVSPKVGLQSLRGALIGNYSRRDSGMDIKRSGSHSSGKGPANHSTGSVHIDPWFQALAPARVVGASVTFEYARNAWHTASAGSALIVTVGCGRAQR